MSHRTSKPFCAILALQALVACTPTLPTLPSLPDIPGFGPETVEVMPGVTLGLPQGYCLDREASSIADEGSALLLGRCHDDVGAVPAVLRVSLGAPGSASVLATAPADLAAYFTSEAGRASLSPSGNPGDIHIVTALSQGPDFLLQIDSTTEGRYWRAITDLTGRLITVSAIGTRNVPLTAQDSRNLVEQTLAAQQD